MLKRAIGLTSVAALVCACAGCDGGVSFSYHDRRPVHRRVTHVHTPRCHDCYHDGTRLVVLKGHRHGPGCGHVWDDTHWVVARKAKVRHAHPHKTVVVKKAPGPNHVYDRRGSKWVRIRKGHVHGPGCGHVYANGRWCRRVH